MTAANRVQLTAVIEVTAGTTPVTPRMRKEKITGEQLAAFVPVYNDPDDLRDDRMDEDALLVFHNSGGAYNFNVIYPPDASTRSNVYLSAFENTWNNTATRDNDGTADSVITAVATTNEVLTVTTGTAYVAGQLVQLSGFGVANNNGIAKCTTGSATVPRFIGFGLTDEAAPPAAARAKVVGFQGASADITATSTGLGSTLLDFTTLGLSVGQMIKIGGTAAGDKFATAALNNYAIISAIAATALTLTFRPSGWTTDAGTGKTIKVWVCDWIKNGTTKASLTLEKGFLGQAVPNYHVATGMFVNKLTHTFAHKARIKGVVEFMGMGGSKSTTSLDASPDAVPTGRGISSNIHTGRLMEGGSSIASPNFCRSLEFSINNNLREIEDMTLDSPGGMNDGNCEVDLKFSTYYGDGTFYDKFAAGTATSLLNVEARDSQALAWFVPRMLYRGGGNPTAQGKNQDVMLDLEARASYDSTYTAHLIMGRFEYVE
jgi:hypothetical protein